MAPAMPPVQAQIHYHSPLPLNEANLVSYLTSLPPVPRLTKLLQACSGPSSQLSDRPIWTPSDHALIKHIPKSARPACASLLASLLRSIAQDPVPVTKWTDLFNWGGAILKPPKRGGKRHDLSATVRKCISTFPAGLTLTRRHSTFMANAAIHTQSARQCPRNSKTAMSGQPYAF